jgi:hypothetical protein
MKPINTLNKVYLYRVVRSIFFCHIVIILLLLYGALPAEALECGIAANHFKDSGIENDPSVIFRENFEETTQNQLLSRWETYKNASAMSFSAEKPAASGGTKSLLFNGDSYLYRRLLPGYDELYVRMYVKFDNSCKEVAHYHWLGGRNPSLSYPQPLAGERPGGNDRFATGVEPMGTNWAWDFYTYWMHMRTNPGGGYYGNTFAGRPSSFSVPHGQWVSLEFMVKMNSPVTAYNGEQAFWINGEKKLHLGQGFPKGTWAWDGFTPDPNGQPFEGFQWRTVPELNINYLWLENYVASDPSCKSWIDDVVVAKKYIGPIEEGNVCTSNQPSLSAPSNLTITN